VAHLLTFLSDFGTADTYVGQVKGAVLAICPDAAIVDLTHEVPRQDVRAGAFHLWAAAEAFAPGAVHLAVVDPGVGGPRRAIAIATRRGDLLVGPDNGLLLPAALRLGGVAGAVSLEEAAFFRPRVSATFHGRDLFGPAAAHLLCGVALAALGPAAAGLAEPFSFPRPGQKGDRAAGEVIHVDGYGNLVTNLDAGLAAGATAVRIRGREIPLRRFYAEVDSGSLVALAGSAGMLEVAVRDGDAAAALEARAGDAVELVPGR